nr:MAG TPA: hypothetical protein [Caudoviricetes sp.]
MGIGSAYTSARKAGLFASVCDFATTGRRFAAK